MVDTAKFEAKLTEQIALLADACHALDAGKAYHIKAISSRAYVVCHDLIRSKDWLIWSDGKVEFVTTAIPPHPGNLLKSHHPLACHSSGDAGPSFSALGSNPPPHKFGFLRFSKWWDELVIRLDEGKNLTRRNLVFQMRNYDGGSHGIEKEPSQEYRAIRDDRGVGWVAMEGGRPTEFRLSALEATTRQIAHELLYTLVPKLGSSNRSRIEYDVMWSPITGGTPTWPQPELAG